MAVHKLRFLALFLVFGTFVLVSQVERADAKACTRECDLRIAYAICPRLGITKKINQLCTNCCAGYKGCNYYSADGKFICEGESEPVISSSEVVTNNKKNNNVEKACTKECDTRIAYGICPLASAPVEQKFKFNRICTNCCAGKKGCNYFSEDGTFICEGESDYNAPKPCTLECDPRIAYGICPIASAPAEQKINFNRICTNCCAGKKGCNYFSADGTFICEGESDINAPKPCTLECDPRIAYGICPLASTPAEKRINFDRICTNCCAGKKGCNYFSADGTFICEGESEYVTNEGENAIAVS